MIEQWDEQAGNYSEETDEDCICLACKEHASVVRVYEDFCEIECVSSCCSAEVHIF